MQIFVSYSRVDKEFVLKIVEALADYDLTVWMDIRNIPHGANWDFEVQKGLETSDLMLVMLTPDSAASANVADEWNFFMGKNKPIVPVIVRPCEVPFRLARRQYVDVSRDMSYGFSQLIRAIGSPKLLDPNKTQKVLPKAPIISPEASDLAEAPESTTPTQDSNAGKSPAPAPRVVTNKMTDSAPQKNMPAPEPEINVRRFSVVWGNSYQWFTGMSDGFTEGDMLVNTREVILVPPDRPIISIPFKNITELTKQEGADPHLSLSYYGNDGKQISFVLMSAAKKNRKSLNEAMLTAMRGLKT